MKKFLTILGSIGLTATVGSNVVSCVAPKYAPGFEGQRVVTITDGGQITDHSFDQATYEGMMKYYDSAYNNNDVDSMFHVDPKDNYIVPQDSSITSLSSSYRLAKLKKADALLLAGFVHMAPLDKAVKLFEDKTIVMIDGSAPDPEVKKTEGPYKNVISVLFNSQIAGMQAGFDAAYWATQKDGKGNLYGATISPDQKEITIGMFGGVTGKYAVDNYLWGMMLGIAVFNEYYSPENVSARNVKNSTKEETRAKIKLANVTSGEIKDVKITDQNPSFYTGGFELGQATRSGIAPGLINGNKSLKPADIIFPVAGSQIEDVIGSSRINSVGFKQPYLVGVDVDQAGVYTNENAKDRFVTSAIKNIQDASDQALLHASSLKTAEGEELVDRKEVWDGTKPDPYLNWSIAQTKGNNKITKNKLHLFNGDGNAKVTGDDKLIEMVNNFYASTGTNVGDYMDGAKIVKLAQDIVKASQDGKFNLVNDKESIGGK
ncbi:lipoprotein [Mesoplasma lactucae]|uniref:Uncharacterized protein n=1 Tax=Mesoplasma lactucae ATCC 49193 TaxID=81460 RepID=A0A291IS57_9MOLU|nr:lipoprotein [Mesoplasma lactucae]ATG97629.1 hypothetical protein CP520_02700 [Mesoplasma lactucae ATCC 49193]ATZ19910.1 ribose/galactose ABC transporter substrate-binding protein [Mesoplasma lactucae ATCC 49193]MCL8216774.1 hypothetical protein [Mesoplasma lactucae ATCC 49193]